MVLEARDRTGGRILSWRDPGRRVCVELGAEFLHGRAPATTELLSSAGLPTVDVGGQRYQRRGRALAPMDDFWEQLDRAMRLLNRRGSDHSFAAFLARRPGGRRLARERALARQWVEGFHAADPDVISAHALAEGGWPADDLEERRLGRVLDGYDRVVASLAAPLAGRVRLASVVTRVEWMPGQVAVFVRPADGRSRFAMDARAIVVTVPVGVLTADPRSPAAIEFAPRLRQKDEALRQLVMGSVVKLTMRLRERFWADRHSTLSFLHTSDPDFPVWWSAYPLQEPLMTGWSGGPIARRLAQSPRHEIEARAVTSLARQFGLSRPRLNSMVEQVWMHTWEHDPFARGAYSYVAVGGADAPAALARPVRRTIFFAGEATDTEGATGTVEGALTSGRRAARQVMRALAR